MQLSENEEEHSYIMVHIDDFIVAVSTTSKVAIIFDEVSNLFEIKDMGGPLCFLGSAVERDYVNKTIIMT